MNDSEYRSDSSDLWKRAIPVIVGILSLIAVPRAAMLSLASPMIFDAPGSTEKIHNWIFMVILIAKPVMLLTTVILAFFVFRRFTRGRFVTMLAIPAIWWLAYWSALAVDVAGKLS